MNHLELPYEFTWSIRFFAKNLLLKYRAVPILWPLHVKQSSISRKNSIHPLGSKEARLGQQRLNAAVAMVEPLMTSLKMPHGLVNDSERLNCWTEIFRRCFVWQNMKVFLRQTTWRREERYIYIYTYYMIFIYCIAQCVFGCCSDC